MKTIRLFAILLLAIPFVSLGGLQAGNVEDDAYFHIFSGGEFKTSGDYDFDPRFQFGFEGGMQYVSLPISFSYGQDIWMIGLKPRVQYLFQPIPEMPNLRVAPGIGPVLNFWSGEEAGIELTAVEFGAQISGHIQYVINETFQVFFTPVAFDLDFYRHITIDTPIGSFDNDGETKLRTVYNAYLGLGVIF